MATRRGVSRYGLAFFAWALPACVLDSGPVLPDDAGAFAEGMCLCAVCWDRPFCWSALLGEGVAAADGAPCPSISRDGRFWGTTRARPASRVGPTFGPRTAGFFCVPPRPDVVLDTVGAECPWPPWEMHPEFGHVDPCIDVPVECRDPANEFLECGETTPPGGPACADPFIGQMRTGCSDKRRGEETSDSAELRARGKVLDACDIRNQGTPPSGTQPGRYCFTSCVREFSMTQTCSERMFDPPEITAGSYFSYVLPGSTVRVATESGVVVVPLEGEVAISAPRCGPGDVCSAAMLPWLFGQHPGAITVDGITLRNLVVRNPVPFRNGAITPVTATRSKLTFDAGKVVYVSADIDGIGGRRGSGFTATAPIVAYLDWTGRTMTVDGTFVYTRPDGDITITLHVVGAIPNLAPRAVAGPDRTLECTGPSGAVVNLSSAGSWDPDAPQQSTDFRAFAWTSVPSSNTPGERTFQSTGTTASFLSPIGTRTYSLQVMDRAGTSTSDGVRVTVRDTVRPTFKQTNLAGQCIQANNGMRLFQPSHLASAFTDQCDASVRYDILNVRTDVPDSGGASSPDIVFGATSFCIRGQREAPTFGERKYYVDVRSYDDSGNSTTSTVIVRVPAGTTCPEGAFWTVPTVSPTSSLCRR